MNPVQDDEAKKEMTAKTVNLSTSWRPKAAMTGGEDPISENTVERHMRYIF